MNDPATDPVVRMQGIAVDDAEWPAVEAGFAFVESVKPLAEDIQGLPRWLGYVVRAAFCGRCPMAA